MRDDMQDARFADAEPGADARPVRLRAEGEADLRVLAALTQDAVGKVADAAFLGKRRRFVALTNRFRWEGKEAAERAGRPYERVRAALTIGEVLCVKARGVARHAPEAVYCLLDIVWEPGAEGAGVVRLVLSGGAEIAVQVEALDVTLEDVSRPWAAGGCPDHEAAA